MANGEYEGCWRSASNVGQTHHGGTNETDSPLEMCLIEDVGGCGQPVLVLKSVQRFDQRVTDSATAADFRHRSTPR